MNKVEFIGRLSKDPEVRYTQNTNTMVASFSIAVKRRFTKEGEQDTDFFNIVAWGKTAEFVSKYFSKGQPIGLVGRIQTKNWEDDKGKHFATEVIAEEVYFAGEKKDTAEQPEDITDDIIGNDLPF